MAVYNTSSDAANTAIRAFLTRVGEYYLGHSFNTASGKGKEIWEAIRDKDFESCCAYCGQKSHSLQIEHLLMFNRTEYGLHHPGNIVPCCKSCNKRERNDDGSYKSWEEHLKIICLNRNEATFYDHRKLKISSNILKYKYPNLSKNEHHSIRVIANSLYENIKAESEKSLDLYKELDKAFVQG
ncbi:MAG TPA: HNH endonuclease [Methylophilus sp.]|nr:HNH endonuclease [Methylophilus sp.]HQQ32910.1 HNH endonuclease [Methylophilus sp.]